jgi:hypothetical protein
MYGYQSFDFAATVLPALARVDLNHVVQSRSSVAGPTIPNSSPLIVERDMLPATWFRNDWVRMERKALMSKPRSVFHD